jgi:gamma-tubulin complex component 5
VIETRFVDSSIAPVVSLLQLHDTIRSLARPLLQVGELASRVPAQVSGFACLELLYDDICTHQATGDTEIYEYLAIIFFDCLKVYLKPVRRWMETGDVVEGDDTFFISITDKGSAASSLWHDRFGLRTTPDGELFAPKFLRPAGKRILNAGKSIVFLRQLGKEDSSSSSLGEPSLDFVSICQTQSSSLLAPFSELFGSAFDDWISSKYGPASSILRQQLFINCGLWNFVDALEHIYFSKDGTRFQAFADEIFRRMDGRKKAWNDRFLLSELARSTFGSIGVIDADRISIRTIQVKASERSIKSLASVVIELNVSYMLPLKKQD